MSQERPIRFHAGDVELDGRIATPEGAIRACVVCHPHPLYGGDMNSSVVTAITRALAAAGVATLRFDFRGVGMSGGTHEGGQAEVEDARAAVATLAEATRLPSVAIAGYSFGSLIALQLAAVETGVSAVAAIAPPLSMSDASFACAIKAPILLMAGDRDSYCSPDKFHELAERLPDGTVARVLNGADHFFAGRESEIGEQVMRWLTDGSPKD